MPQPLAPVNDHRNHSSGSLPVALTARVLRRAVDILPHLLPSWTRTSVCQPATIVGPLFDEGLSTFACRPYSLPELSWLPLLDEPERKMPQVPGFSVRRISRVRV